MAPEPSLYEGDAGVDGWVETLQLALRRSGHDPGPVDGAFGWRTAKAVVEFQQANGLEANGVAGNQTWAALMGRPAEEPGVDNGPHGGLAAHPHASQAEAIPGVGWEPEAARLEFTSQPTFDGDAVSVSLDVQPVTPEANLAIVIWAELYQGNGGPLLEQSAAFDVSTVGSQRIALTHSYPPGDYEVTVYATDNAGTTINIGSSQSIAP